MRRNILASLPGVAILLSAGLFAHADTALRVEIGGQQVTVDPPPLIIGDRVLVPVRGVFEQLGATLVWEDPATHAVIVSRAVAAGQGTQIRLIAGSRLAYINDSPVTLDVAPLIVAGRTFVPLRFVSEALLATVAWNPGLRLVAIAPGLAPPSLPPAAAPAPPKEGPAEGTVVRVDLAARPPAVIITWYGNQTRPFTVAPDTAFFRRDLNADRLEPIQLRQIFPGDALSLVVEVGGGPGPRGTIRRGEVLVREARGRVESAIDRTLVFGDGRSFVLAAGARFIVGGSFVAQPPDLAEKLVVVRVQPLTQQVVEVEVTG